MDELEHENNSITTDASTEPETAQVPCGMPGSEEKPDTEKSPDKKPKTNFPPFVYKACDRSRVWFRDYRKDRGYLLIGALLAMLIMYGLDIVMQIPPWGNGSVMVLDLNAQYVYFFEGLRRAVYGNADFLYSFSRSMGGEFMGIYAYYLASPFSYIVALFPEGCMQEALTTIFILKSGFLAYTFGWYLHKTDKVKNRLTVVIFSILYAFTSYAVVQQHNTMWIDALMWLPLLTYGIEQLVKRGRFRMFVFFLTLTIMSNFYIGYMICIYVVLYFFAYYLMHGGDATEEGLRPEKFHFLRSLFRIGFWSCVAVAASAVIIFTAYYSLKFGKTTFSNPNWAFSLRFDFYQLLAKFFPATYDTVDPAGLPFVYCGILSLLLIPVYFTSSKFSIREKAGYALICLFLLLSFSINTADIFWHGFQKPNWLNYRYSFLLDFLMLVMAYKAYRSLEEKGLKILVGSGMALAGVVIWLQTQTFSKNNFRSKETVLVSLIAIGLYLVIVPFCIRGKRKQLASVFLLLVVGIEVFLNGAFSIQDMDKDVGYTHYSYYNNYNEKIREIMNKTMTEDPTFYRMEKTTMRKKNDAFVFGMRGIAGSTSTLNQSTLDFLDSIGYSAASHWSYYYTGTVPNDSLLGIKYVASDSGIDNSVMTEAFTDSKETYTAYLNPYALSIAFGASDKLISYKAEDYPNAIDRINAIYSMLVGSDEILEVYKPVEIIAKGMNGIRSSASGEYTRYYQTAGSFENTISFSVYVPTGADVVMYIGSAHPEPFMVTYGDYSKEIEDIAGKRIFYVGTSQTDVLDTIYVDMDDTNLYMLTDCNIFYYVDYELLGQIVEQLRSQELVTDPSSTDGKITGTMHIEEDNTFVFTSIAYDAGWRVYIDGKRVSTYETADALLSFRADAGDHVVKLKYLPDCFVLGLILTIGASIFFILVCVFWSTISKWTWVRVLFVPEDRPAPEPSEVPVEEESADEEIDPDEYLKEHPDVTVEEIPEEPEETPPDDPGEEQPPQSED